MHRPLSKSEIAAINATDTNVSVGRLADKFVIDADTQWFSRIARQLLAPKPGLFLHLATDCGERNGHRYASGEVPVSSHVWRILQRSDQGGQWLAGIMDGSEAQWWREYQRAVRITAQVDRLDLR